MNHLFILSAATVLLFFFLSPLSTAAAGNTELVLDIEGNPLEENVEYYIAPVIRGRGGGLTLDSKNSTQLCPLYVAQENDEVSNGLPVKLFPVNPKDKNVPLSTDLNIDFDVFNICVQSTLWSLKIDEDSGRRYVGAGGQIGNPGKETISNWFKIEKAGSGDYDYKIVYCPGVCEICRPFCGEVGVFIEEDGRRLLGLTGDDHPLLVMFKKA